MSSDPVGGYIVFPPTLAQADLITTTIKAMELEPDGFDVQLPEEGVSVLSEGGFPFRTDEPLEQALAHLAQKEGGAIEGRGPKSSEMYWFEPPAASYPVVTFWVVSGALDSKKYPADTDYFVERWLQLCEQGQALFGYFSPFGFKFDREYLEEKILPVFLHGTASQILQQVLSSWLIYLGPELAERWRQEQMPLPSPLLVSQDLPSGAHFFRTSEDVYEASPSRLLPGNQQQTGA